MTTPEEATRNDDPWPERRHLPPATDKRGGYPGSGHGPTMPPPPPDPSGSPPPRDVSDAFTWSEPIHGDLNPTYSGTLGRVLDPVRAYALAQAVGLVKDASSYVSDPEALAEAASSALAIAKEFELYLVGEETEAP